MKKVFSYLLIALFVLLSAGCSLAGDADSDMQQTMTEAPVYGRSTILFTLSEDANPYMMEYAEEGFFYFVMEQSKAEEGQDSKNEWKTVYRFYYQTYDGEAAVPFCKIENGIVRDFSGIKKDGKNHLAILWIGEEACITEFDEAGNICGNIILDKQFNNLDEIPELCALPDGEYAIGMSDMVYVPDVNGQITKTLKLEGAVRKFIIAEENTLFALVEKSEGGNNSRCLVKLDVQKGKAEEVKELDSGLMGLFAFEDGLAAVFPDRVDFIHADREKVEPLIDLNRQSLIASELQYIYGNHEEIHIVSKDQGYEGIFITLGENITSDGADTSKEPDNEAESDKETEKPLYAPDGRRIIHVAVPEKYYFEIEYHAKKYNQTCDNACIEVERFEGSLEDYLGKGNRPDIVMFTDQTEIPAYVQKDALVNLLPLFDEQEKYSLDGIIPKVRELLGAEGGEKMYGMAWMFRLLLRTSDGTEYDSDGKCDSVDYLKWYDGYLTENEITGVGRLEDFLYAAVGDFYNEETAEAYFTTDEFKNLMEVYKEVLNHHKGDIDWQTYHVEKGYTGQGIIRGPRWNGSYSIAELTEQSTTMEGMPGSDGENHVYMKLDYPMSILRTSECSMEAFDFIMYYAFLDELMMKGDYAGYGKGGNTYAYFTVSEENINKQIYESEKPYAIRKNGTEFFYTDEQKDHLKALINSAVSNTKAQSDIYAMFMEEMDAYLKGDKDLDSACEILQNRAELYLQENK